MCEKSIQILTVIKTAKPWNIVSRLCCLITLFESIVIILDNIDKALSKAFVAINN